MIHNNKVRGVIIIAWLTVIGVMSDGKYSQLKGESSLHKNWITQFESN